MADQPNRCKARQYSDQMHCASCGLTWDMNDPEPPSCNFEAIAPTIESLPSAREQALAQIRAALADDGKECCQCGARVNYLVAGNLCKDCTRLITGETL